MSTSTSFSLSRNLHNQWPWILSFGILSVVLGFIAIAFVGFTSLISVIYLGLLLMIVGITEIVYAVRAREHSDLWFHLLFGVLTTVCGWFVFSNPIPNMVLLTILIATLFLVTGTVTLVGSIVERFENWAWFALNGAVSILAGYFILGNPLESSAWLIGLLVGVQMLFRGFAWISLGLLGRSKAGSNRTSASQRPATV